MLWSCFQSEEDHESIDLAMANFPTIAIFMSQVHKEEKKKKLKKQPKSIFDVKDGNLSKVQCLAAVCYHCFEQHTQVLWLSTTIQKPPVESIHVVWRKLGLGTYLLCMLIKQHTGIGTGSLDGSVLTLQASAE